METRITVVNIFDFLGPTRLGITMHLVKKQVSATMCIMIISQINQTVIIKPQLIKRHIKGLIASCRKGFGNALQQQGCLANTSGSTNAQHPRIPRQLIVQVAFVFSTYLINKPVTIGI